MTRSNLRTPEEWQKVVEEYKKACKNLNEIIREKDKEILELNKKMIHFRNCTKKLKLEVRRLKLGE